MRDANQTQQIDIGKAVAEFAKPDLSTSFWQLANSILPYLAILFLMYKSLATSYWITIFMAFPAAGFLIRIFIIFHDCGHNSFFRLRAANYWTGSFLGFLLYVPFAHWKFDHAQHHASVCNLDYRGAGDIWTLSVNDFMKASGWRRFLYRFARSPFFFLIFPPLFLKNRFVPKGANLQQRYSIYLINLWLVVVAILAHFSIGITNFILIQLPVLMIASAVGIWLFYVQHQFRGALWQRSSDWDQVKAALRGTSYYKLPRLLQWFSGNIGFHNVHHLSPRVPNYNLEKCHKSNPILQGVPILTFSASLQTLRNHLWDEDASNFIDFNKL